MCDEPGPCKLRVRLSGNEDALRSFLREYPPGCERAEPDPRVRGQWSIDADVEAGMIPHWTSRGLRVEVLHDIAQRSRELARWVGKGNRFAKGARLHGLGVARPKAA